MQSIQRVLGIGIAVLLASSLMAQDKPKGDGKHGDKPDGKRDGKPAAATVAIGQDAPAFELKGHDGKTYKLSDYKDKVVVIEWINRECPVSLGKNETMRKTSETYAAKGVVWLAIDSTGGHKAEDNASFIAEKGIKYPILSDADGATGHAYGAKTTPHMFIVNKGKLAYMGAIDDDAKSPKTNYVSAALDEILAGKAVTTSSTKSYGCSVKYAKKD